MQKNFIQINTVVAGLLDVQEWGNGDPIIFLPGANVYLRDLDDIISPLSNRFRVIAVKYPNDNCLRKGKRLDLCEYFAVIDSVVEHFSLSNYYIVGQSMGGGIALAYASQNSSVKKVVGLVPFLSGMKSPLSAYWQNMRNIAQWAKTEKTTAPFLSIWRNLIHSRRLFRLFHALQSYDVREYVSKVQVPTLLVIGKNDVMYKSADIKNLVSGKGNYEVVELENVGHSLIHVQSELVGRTILEFLNN